MSMPTCPTCGAEVEQASRGVDMPAFLEPCGHFALIRAFKPVSLEPHPAYGADVRAHEIDLEAFHVWQLVASRNGKRAPYPPAHWVLNFGKRGAQI